jgi:integrase
MLKRDGKVVARVCAKTEELCWERLRAAERGENPLLIRAERAPTLASYAEKWLGRQSGARGGPIKQNTQIGYDQKVRLHILPHFGHEVRVDQITPKAVSEFFAKLRKDGLSNSSIANVRNVLSGILGAARLEGHITENAAKGHNVGEAGSGFNVVGFSDDLARKILDAVRESDFRDPLSLLLYCPMREGEILRLTWNNVFMNERRLTVMATDTRVWAPAGSGHYATRGVGTPKTRSGKRDVPIPSEAERLLRRRYIAMGCPKKGLVFPSQTNPDVPVSARVLLTEFKRRMTLGRLPVTKIHELRHIGISLLLDHGVDPSLVAQIAGHANANITRRFYGHVLDGRAYAAAETLTFFGSKSAGQAAAGTPRKGPENGVVSTRVDTTDSVHPGIIERKRA